VLVNYTAETTLTSQFIVANIIEGLSI